MWQDLFVKALKALDASKVSGDEWTFGGGTALTVYFQLILNYLKAGRHKVQVGEVKDNLQR